MISVIIAGGSGTRLWPLSTPAYPKHLLTINDSKRSLLQHTYDRVSKLSQHVYVVPEIGHADHVKAQLPKLAAANFVVEPARRGTASCLVAALAHLEDRHAPDEPIALVSADHYIRDVEGFVHSFKVAAEVSKQTGRIVLVGVEPDYPATGFGYIKKGQIYDEDSFVFDVQTFKEKPAYEVAKRYVKSGNYLWNCSYFIGSQSTFKQNMKRHAPELYKKYQQLKAAKSAKQYQAAYLSFDTNSIDYALMEKVADLLVVPAAFDWMDVGSFMDLHKAVESDEQGNHVYGQRVEVEGVENSFIQNHEPKPLAVVGLDNVVVINSKHGILVARKDLAQKIGEVSKKLNEST